MTATAPGSPLAAVAPEDMPDVYRQPPDRCSIPRRIASYPKRSRTASIALPMWGRETIVEGQLELAGCFLESRQGDAEQADLANPVVIVP